MRWRYDVNGLCLAIEAEGLDLVAQMNQYFAPFATDAGGEADYSIAVSRGPVAQTGRGGDVPLREQDRLVVDGQFSVTTDRSKRVTHVRMDHACDRPSENLAAIHAIDAALAASGQYLLHGAALALPGEPPRAVLMFGASGSGKTTAALALALGGFGFITDDAIVLQPPGNQQSEVARVWGLPRPIKVHRRTAELLPAIAPLLSANWDSADEQTLQTAALRGLAQMMPPRPIPIVAIAVLGERSSSGHCIEAIDKGRALSAIAQDNLRRSRRGVSPDYVERFAAIGRLLAATPVFQVRVGSAMELFARQLGTALSAGTDRG